MRRLKPIYIVRGVFSIPRVVYVTRSIVPFTGLQTSPRIPLPRPFAPPLRPPDLAPFTGSVITPATAENILVNIDLVPTTSPDATLDG